MTLTNFRAEDFKSSGGTVKAIGSTRDKKVKPEPTSTPTPTTEPIVAKDADPETVPSGTVPEVLTWVGEDPVRAQKALDVEVDNEKPRQGLVKQLTELIDKEAEDTKADADEKAEEK